MPQYLTFTTLEDAQTALDLIDLKCRQAVATFNPLAIDEVGVIPRNAATGQLTTNSTRTTTWATIQETIDGKFVFPLITTAVNPVVFAEVDFLEGMVGYSIEEYNPAWFPQENLI